MYAFSFTGYLVLILVLLLCLAALLFFYKQMKNKLMVRPGTVYKKYGLFFIFFGLVLMIAAMIGYCKVLADIEENPGILQPVTLMVSEPVLIFLVSGFLIGLTLSAAGAVCLRIKVLSGLAE